MPLNPGDCFRCGVPIGEPNASCEYPKHHLKGATQPMRDEEGCPFCGLPGSSCGVDCKYPGNHALMTPEFEPHPHAPPLGESMVVLPKHYSRFEIEPVRFTVTNKLDLLEANVVKYTLRAPYKHGDNGKQDYMKAIRCLVMKAKQMQGDPDWWRPYKTDIEANLERELSYAGS